VEHFRGTNFILSSSGKASVPVLVTHFITVTKISDRNNLKEKRFILPHGRLPPLPGRTPWHRAVEWSKAAHLMADRK
jgi:hypothetical protein